MAIGNRCPPYNKLHVALLPSDSDSKLISRLLKYNIETIIYDPSDNHKALWDAIKMAQKEIRTNPRVAPERFESIKGLGRFIASTYSRMKVRDAPEPLRVNRNWCGKSPPLCQLFLVLQVVMPILNIGIFFTLYTFVKPLIY